MCLHHNWVKGTHKGSQQEAKICCICGQAELRYIKKILWRGRRHGPTKKFAG